MNRFRPENLDHIQTIFQNRTGVELPRMPRRRPVRAGLALAAALV